MPATLYRTNLSSFADALAAIANAIPTAPTFDTAGTASRAEGAIYASGTAGAFFAVTGNALTYNAATGRLVGGIVGRISFQDPAAGAFAIFDAQQYALGTVQDLVAASRQPDPFATLTVLTFTPSAITADTRTLTASGRDDLITVGNTMDSRIDGAAGLDTAIYGAFRADAAVSGGAGSETVVLAGHTSTLVSIERMQFLDGQLIESPAARGGQLALAFRTIYGRLPDGINAGGYSAMADRFGLSSAVQSLLDTPEARVGFGALDDNQFATRVYASLLNRAPTDAEATTARTASANGLFSRGNFIANLVASTESLTANANAFGTGLFVASPGAVDTLRAYQVLLGRLPEASSLSVNAAALDQAYANSFVSLGKSLPDLYRAIQSSAEFAARTTPNPYGITAGTAFGAIYTATHSDALTATNLALITQAGGIPHLPG